MPMWIEHIEPFVLLIARFGGLCVFAPVLSTASIPLKAKALLIFMFAVASYPGMALASPLEPAADLAMLGVSVAIEASIGAAIGFFAALPLYAAQLGGLIIDHQMGLGLGAVYNPLLDTEGTVLGDLLMYIAMATFLSIGGMDVLYVGVLRTCEQVPLASFQAPTPPLRMLTAMVTSGCELSLRLAAPVLCIILVELICSTFIMKTMPQINIMSIGFPIKVLLGFTALILATRALGGAIAEFSIDGVDTLLEWTGALRAG